MINGMNNLKGKVGEVTTNLTNLKSNFLDPTHTKGGQLLTHISQIPTGTAGQQLNLEYNRFDTGAGTPFPSIINQILGSADASNQKNLIGAMYTIVREINDGTIKVINDNI